MRRIGILMNIIVSGTLWLPSFSMNAVAVEFTEWPVSAGGNGHYYGITDSATDWQTAENLAISLGGHLASINSAEEQAFIETTFLVGEQAGRPLWVGLSDEAVEGTFEWVTGEPLTYTKWKSGEPNNTSGNEDYVAINWEHGRGGPLGTWNDCPVEGTPSYGTGTAGPYFALIELPGSPMPILKLTIRLSPESDSVDLCWDTQTEAVYQLDYRTSLQSGSWEALGGTVLGTGSEVCTNDPLAGQAQRFYRVRQLSE